MTPYDFLEDATASIASNRKAAEVRRELYAHFLMKVDDLVAEGMDRQTAEEGAIASLGDPTEIAAGYLPVYAASPASHSTRSYILAAIPLILVMIAAANRPSYAVVWVVLATAIAGMLISGKTWQQRVQALYRLIREVPLLWAVGLLGGAAAAIGTVSLSGENGILFLFEFLLPWLALLFYRWREREMVEKTNAFHLAWVVSSAYLVAGGLVFILTHLDVNPTTAYSTVQPVTTVGVSLLPISLLALSYAWDWVQTVGVHRFRFSLTRQSSKVDS